jgi:DNA repair and recombination protein RAD52
MNDNSNGNLRHGDNRRGDNNIVVDSTIDSTSSLVSSSNNHSEEERKPLDADEMSAINAIENNFLASTTSATSFGSEYVRNHDGSMLLDHKSRPITIAKILATKPLRHELATRPGPGNRKLTYMSGDSVTRILNDVFGFDGWCLEVKSANRVVRRNAKT